MGKLFSDLMRILLTHGVVVAFKFIIVRLLARDVWVTFRGYEHPVLIRAGHTDIYVAFHIFVKREYTTPLIKKTRVILDLGANVGYAAVFFAKHYPDAKVVCLEPSPENYAVLLKNIAPYKNVEAINKGVWSKNTRVDLINPDAACWAYQFEEVATGGIECISIDDLVETYACDGLIMTKIDIEGTEKNLFADATTWLDRVSCIQMEIHDCWKPVFDRLADYDYRAQISGENNVVYLHNCLDA